MKYDYALKNVFAAGKKKGLFNDSEDVLFSYDPVSMKTIIVFESGCYNSGLPECVDVAESLWMITNHPNHKHLYTINSLVNKYH